ncbi:xanthine dehydrogenase accessory protein XdhC [Microbulbifer sp. CAU 1566]|uniref:xanthine dehydrogenase accessory protein XdhC n=1 Tax=Microbulbifer sp. CAU 1566 TaxID=2933269 RepID=UPI0020068828|nr:xanthine dehydrogenase accessory protein XdhC [Microbulbifer sp. CAU 1566]MCK7596110.1 xanthine dehydrogenase accessory protein XdhC [Microbulbifer sp. CAU 1566]
MMQQLPWHKAVADCENRGEPYVLVTVLGVTGSVPREPASKMVITGSDTYDTIGGGHLEYKVIERARARLDAREYGFDLAHFPLGASLGQCCGGSVAVLLEAHGGSEAHLVVFGAGHVAQALMTVVGQLPWQITWVDSRAETFPQQVPANVTVHHTDDPAGDAPELCRGAHALILTHNHALDFDLCWKLLEQHRQDQGLDQGQVPASIGLIGSQTKAVRFQQRLQQRGFSEEEIRNIRCPVGRSDVPGKRPMEVAVSISAEMITLVAEHRTGERADSSKATRRGLQWNQLKALQAQEPQTGQAIGIKQQAG